MSNQGKIKIKLDIRKNLDSPDSKFMMILLGPEAKKISDLVDKVRLLCPWILDSDEVEVYQDKYLLPNDEEIGLINTKEDVIVIPISRNNDVVLKGEYVETNVKTKTERYIESECDKTQHDSEKRSSKTDADMTYDKNVANSLQHGPPAPKKILNTKMVKRLKIGQQMPIPNLTPHRPGLPTPSVPRNQKVQIVKSADGEIQVRGLLPGQQLIRMLDGSFHIQEPG